MNFLQRFLHLFADYREAVETATHKQDEALSLRGQLDDLQKRYDAMVADTLAREREVSDRFMRARMPDRALNPNAPIAPAPEQANQPETPAQWKVRKNREFEQALEERARVVNGQ